MVVFESALFSGHLMSNTIVLVTSYREGFTGQCVLLQCSRTILVSSYGRVESEWLHPSTLDLDLSKKNQKTAALFLHFLTFQYV